jgi:DNA mismatch endonuclease (patch repair protein)
MRGNKGVNTKPEIALRSALHRLGYRFRVNYVIREGGERVAADIVFTRYRVAVFVDGCFWHCCPVHGNQPRANSEYWSRKLQRNVERDRRVDQWLVDAGWRVIRIWEHEDPRAAVAQIRDALRHKSARSHRRS